MDVKNEMYVQRPFFQTGMPLFGVALLFLLPAICFCLRRNTFLLEVALLVIGLLLIMLGVGRIKGETKHILRFVRKKSNFYHKYDPPLTISGILERLQEEGFEVAEYPFGNYYCHRYIGRKYCCHFLVANNDTPDCPEAESYSSLFIRTVYGAGSQYLLDLEYGAGLEQKSPEYIQAVHWNKTEVIVVYAYYEIVNELLAEFPEISKNYAEEIAWIKDTFKGQETGGQTIYFDRCFCDYIGHLLVDECQDNIKIEKVFTFLEDMAVSEDQEVRNLLQVTVLEYLRSWYLLQSRSEKLMLPETKKIFAHVKSCLQEPAQDVLPCFYT